MKFSKQLLRDAARAVLERRGERVSLKHGPGIVPGARLIASVDGAQPSRTVSVRTSQDRQVGLMRNEKGNWRTIAKVDEVLVAASSEDGTAVEVLSFKPQVLADAFDDALGKRPNLKRDHRLPLFIPLDDKRSRRAGEIITGLKRKCSWQETFAPNEQMLRRNPEKLSRLIADVRDEFARLSGVDASRVIVAFNIQP